MLSTNLTLLPLFLLLVFVLRSIILKLVDKVGEKRRRNAWKKANPETKVEMWYFFLIPNMRIGGRAYVAEITVADMLKLVKKSTHLRFPKNVAPGEKIFLANYTSGVHIMNRERFEASVGQLPVLTLDQMTGILRELGENLKEQIYILKQKQRLLEQIVSHL